MIESDKKKSYINLGDIKSSFIIKEIVSFLHEKQLLNIIIYNKGLQKNYLVDLECYKKQSEKYKIGEKNGKGKEYTLKTNKLIFEGEYLNGLKNGKGKEFYENGKLKFEGEYINGKRWNGKGYNERGKIELELENGKGNIREYYFNSLKFEGEYSDGNLNGKGKEYNKNGQLIFEGEFLNG